MTSIPKIVYLDKLDDMVNECNIACHRSIKMKSNDVNNDIYKVTLIKKLMIKTPI